ncbi:AAA family ATPase [Frankia sp. CiP1_Cm_nod2]|uniref:AAA family ATPase n=1 Tax=Frankia sp. CiP1_Cm_nod2 TaxID=2897161 RepID=UPI0020241280
MTTRGTAEQIVRAAQKASEPIARDQPPARVGTLGTLGTQPESEAGPDLLAGVHNGDWLNSQTFPDLKYAVPDVVPEGFTLIVGPPKAGKSWLTLGLLLAVAQGGRALGAIEIPTSGRVLYLALEDGDRRMQARCRRLLGGEVLIPVLFHYITKIIPGRVIETIEAFLRLHPDTAFVVIDTLGKVMPPAMVGESSYQRDYRIGSALKGITDGHPGLALAVLHHDRKAMSDDFVDSVSGTHGLAGAADTIVVLGRKRQSSEGVLKVTGRDIEENEYALITDAGTWTLDGQTLTEAAERVQQRAEQQDLSDQTNQILEFVRKHPDSAATGLGVQTSEIVTAFGEVRVYLTRLVKSGKLAKASRGRYRVPSVPSVPSGGRSASSLAAPLPEEPPDDPWPAHEDDAA